MAANGNWGEKDMDKEDISELEGQIHNCVQKNQCVLCLQNCSTKLFDKTQCLETCKSGKCQTVLNKCAFCDEKCRPQKQSELSAKGKSKKEVKAVKSAAPSDFFVKICGAI